MTTLQDLEQQLIKHMPYTGGSAPGYVDPNPTVVTLPSAPVTAPSGGGVRVGGFNLSPSMIDYGKDQFNKNTDFNYTPTSGITYAPPTRPSVLESSFAQSGFGLLDSPQLSSLTPTLSLGFSLGELSDPAPSLFPDVALQLPEISANLVREDAASVVEGKVSVLDQTLQNATQLKDIGAIIGAPLAPHSTEQYTRYFLNRGEPLQSAEGLAADLSAGVGWEGVVVADVLATQAPATPGVAPILENMAGKTGYTDPITGRFYEQELGLKPRPEGYAAAMGQLPEDTRRPGEYPGSRLVSTVDNATVMVKDAVAFSEKALGVVAEASATRDASTVSIIKSLSEKIKSVTGAGLTRAKKDLASATQTFNESTKATLGEVYADDAIVGEIVNEVADAMPYLAESALEVVNDPLFWGTIKEVGAKIEDTPANLRSGWETLGDWVSSDPEGRRTNREAKENIRDLSRSPGNLAVRVLDTAYGMSLEEQEAFLAKTPAQKAQYALDINVPFGADAIEYAVERAHKDTTAVLHAPSPELTALMSLDADGSQPGIYRNSGVLVNEAGQTVGDQTTSYNPETLKKTATKEFIKLIAPTLKPDVVKRSPDLMNRVNSDVDRFMRVTEASVAKFTRNQTVTFEGGDVNVEASSLFMSEAERGDLVTEDNVSTYLTDVTTKSDTALSDNAKDIKKYRTREQYDLTVSETEQAARKTDYQEAAQQKAKLESLAEAKSPDGKYTADEIASADKAGSEAFHAAGRSWESEVNRQFEGQVSEANKRASTMALGSDMPWASYDVDGTLKVDEKARKASYAEYGLAEVPEHIGMWTRRESPARAAQRKRVVAIKRREDDARMLASSNMRGAVDAASRREIQTNFNSVATELAGQRAAIESNFSEDGFLASMDSSGQRTWNMGNAMLAISFGLQMYQMFYKDDQDKEDERQWQLDLMQAQLDMQDQSYQNRWDTRNPVTTGGGDDTSSSGGVNYGTSGAQLGVI